MGEEAQIDASAWVGRVLDGRYRIERVLGEGGMGAVFAAEQIALQKPVALKVILPALAGDPELAQRFAREAMVSAKLDHPHVASALDYGILRGEDGLEGGAYLVMQLARGRGLRSWMREAGGDWRLAIVIGAQAADALAAAHAAGIVHRDLKPENVVVEDRDGTPHARVLDFGIARVADTAKEGPLTRVGTIMGTPGYMAPEQALGEAVDARADVYALGVMLWELVTGRALFEQDDFGAIVSAQLTSSAPPLSSVVPDVPPALDALVASMLEGTKTKRPASGAEVRDALRAAALALGVSARTSRASVEAASGPTPVAATARTELARVSVAHAATEIAREVTPSIVHPAPTELAPAAPTGVAREAAPSFVQGASAAHPATTEGHPSRSLLGWILGAGAAGVLTLVALSCVVTRVACSGSPEVAASTPTTPGAPALPAASPRAPSAPPPRALPPMPADLAHDVTVLETHPDANERARAVTRLAPRAAELPAYVRALLAYETSADCEDRREAIRAMRALGDPRALPPLHRIAATPPTGCGRRRNRDCDRCLRRDLDRALEGLAGTPAD